MTKIEAKELSLCYSGSPVVHQLSSRLHEGEVTVLVGPNGCGKSTLLRGLARLLRPRGGEVVLDGKAIHRLPTKELARRLAILPQGPSAPEGLTVFELVAQGRYPHQSFFQQWDAEDERVTREALETTGVAHLADRPLDTLSGGQRQRAWIAMALAQATPVLLLDEPTTFLDIGYQVEVMELVRRLNHERRMTVVLVLHDLNQAARYADRLLVMQAGRIVADGHPHQIITPQLLADVFSVRARIIHDHISGVPVCVPYATIER